MDLRQTKTVAAIKGYEENKPAPEKVIADKPTKSGYVPGSLYAKNNKRKVNFKETDNTKEGLDAIQFIEKHYPETAKEFQRLQFEQWNLFCKKQMDYGPSNIAMGTSLDTPEEKRKYWLDINIKYSKIWPNLTTKDAGPLPDAEKWDHKKEYKGDPEKKEHFSEKPGLGDDDD